MIRITRMTAIIAPAMILMMRAASWSLCIGGVGVVGIITGGIGSSVLVMEVLLVPGLLPVVDGLLLMLSDVL